MSRTAHVRRCRWCAGPQVHEGSASARILDLLEECPTPQGWTSRQIADRLGLNVQAVRRALVDLKKAQLVTGVRRPHGVTLEYRAKRRPQAPDRTWPPTLTAGFMCSCGQFLPNPHRLPTVHILSAHHEEHVHPDRRVS